jgi:hypothetical protein
VAKKFAVSFDALQACLSRDRKIKELKDLVKLSESFNDGTNERAKAELTKVLLQSLPAETPSVPAITLTASASDSEQGDLSDSSAVYEL